MQILQKILKYFQLQLHVVKLICLIFSSISLISAQESQIDAKYKRHKNIVRFNITNPVIYGKRAIIFGYERTLGKNHSVCVNVGPTGFRNLSNSSVSSSILSIEKEVKNTGYHFSTEYRYYLRRENKYLSPRGIYIGPYFSLNNIRKENQWHITTNSFDGQLTTDFNLNIYSMGIELGYQFVLWNRLSIDFIFFGPGIAFFNHSFKTDFNLSSNDAKSVFNEFNNFMDQKYPGFKKIATNFSYEGNSSNNTRFFSYRFIVHFGFNF